MALLSLVVISRSGVAPAPVAADVAGDTFPNGGQEFLRIINGSGAPITATAAITETVDGVTPAGKQITVPAGESRYFGPFPPSQYNDTNGRVAITYSAVTSVTVEAVELLSVSNT